MVYNGQGILFYMPSLPHAILSKFSIVSGIAMEAMNKSRLRMTEKEAQVHTVVNRVTGRITSSDKKNWVLAYIWTRPLCAFTQLYCLVFFKFNKHIIIEYLLCAPGEGNGNPL